ncbi:hypothetical protein BDV26DRAFT_273620 [Aspergillus bertholletiae]|uniref:Uncharacterized protein n=1 Tax=Aspergillus bertholletiae TaxID=1226010 RepID=A0A5N7AS55_9EURO|nr:hypothetical protein BDV26DRAFT_273620 [Aspergillus bertholletiae]
MTTHGTQPYFLAEVCVGSCILLSFTIGVGALGVFYRLSQIIIRSNGICFEWPIDYRPWMGTNLYERLGFQFLES